MKRLIAMILCIMMLLPLVACTAEESKTTTQDNLLGAMAPAQNDDATEEEKKSEGKEEEKSEEGEKVVYNHVVNDLSTPDRLAALPIANSSMSTEELRQLCVDFFNLSMSFTWIPDRDYNYVVESQNYARVLEKGKLTAGVPYITVGHGSIYRMMEFYDPETGIVNMAPFMQDPKVLGNACSGGASWSWARVVNSVTPQWTWGMTHANGFLKVGPYEYDLTLTSLGRLDGDYGTPEIVAKNGKQVMFESYAAAHKADGIVNTGHVRMITAEPHVEYNEDGTINGARSYLVCSDQICYNTKEEKYGHVQEDGTKYMIAGGMDWKYTFNDLFGTKYIPFTFAEFQGTDPVEDAVATIAHTGETASRLQLTACTVNANYTISDVFFVIEDAEGKEVFSYVRRRQSFMKYTFELASAIPPEATTNKYADGNHKVKLYVQLGNGEKFEVYSGTFVKD